MISINVKSFAQLVSESKNVVLHGESTAAANSTFAIGGVSCVADSFVLTEIFVLRMNISGKNPAHRKFANR
jgi:hypothetical protein